MMASFLSGPPGLLSDTIPGRIAGWKADLGDRGALKEDTSVQFTTIRQQGRPLMIALRWITSNGTALT
jgi:hypothetical protein